MSRFDRSRIITTEVRQRTRDRDLTDVTEVGKFGNQQCTGFKGFNGWMLQGSSATSRVRDLTDLTDLCYYILKAFSGCCRSPTIILHKYFT
ncbi:MAG: hypothetical protein ICV80_23115 [Microcoleus sp. T1-bin1]|nr:hypothetical protein [Microcoleus sp. T1-bin1]